MEHMKWAPGYRARALESGTVWLESQLFHFLDVWLPVVV